MRSLAVVALGFLLAGGLSAQHRPVSGFGNVVFPGTGGPPVRPGLSGFGNVLFPGTGRAPLHAVPKNLHPFSITDPTFAQGVQRVVSGRRTAFSRGRSPFVHKGTQFVYVPAPYPVYADPYGLQQQPQVTVVYPPPSPPVVINQRFGGAAQAVLPEDEAAENEIGEIKVYQAPARSPEEMAAAAPTAPYYLIAFKDHSIYSAVAYWIDGDTLHYFTSGNNHNQVSMALVDRELTERLNRERKVDVRLP